MSNATLITPAKKLGQSAYTTRTCATPECGKTYRSTSRHCATCRAVERQCIGCGKTMKSVRAKCSACSATQRVCIECGRTFKGKGRACSPCSTPDRECVDCGRVFRGTNLRCLTCRYVARECIECGRELPASTSTKCGKCRSSYRPCEGCGREFKGRGRKCRACARTVRNCVGCGVSFEGDTANCGACATTERDCSLCGKPFKWRGMVSVCMPCRWRTDPEFRGMKIAASRAHRARKAGAAVLGPVSTAVQAAILAVGTCVYCDGPAEELDHVWPLAKGGLHHESNLVPACGPCNKTKNDRWLLDWDPGRVAHGRRRSPKVRAVYEQLKAGRLSLL
ncbi:HNH endonuclease [Streptomyces platensis]|uniref:HNH endonuclease n=1 Tax=Streptomyces platensis TaxID=58346 RepID=UPI0039909421